MGQRTYMAIDLKSFYASVECVMRGLDPLTTNLVVADSSRTNKTICLAVSPSLKAYGVPSRPRLFEVEAALRDINSKRRWFAPGKKLTESTYNDLMLRADPGLSVGYITATPRMALYMEYSAKIYGIYLKYFAPEDIHVYSIDEVFIDVTHYTRIYKLSARELASSVVESVFEATGITATVGIGTNLYLAKVAMDIVAKHMEADKNGARVAELNEMSYKRMLWEHRPLTDFWRVGRGYRKKLEDHGMFNMGDVAIMSLKNEALLYKLFGVNAELLIDHAWGEESCEMEDIKSYRPSVNCLSSGQVLSCPYECEKARVVLIEMCDALSIEMMERGVVTNHVTLTVSYDSESLERNDYEGEITIDYYGRAVPRNAHGSAQLVKHTASTAQITEAVMSIFRREVDPRLLIRRLNISVANVLSEESATGVMANSQISFFESELFNNERSSKRKNEKANEKCRQNAVVEIKKRFGKNAIVRGISFEDGATAIDRNMQIGGHKA